MLECSSKDNYELVSIKFWGNFYLLQAFFNICSFSTAKDKSINVFHQSKTVIFYLQIKFYFIKLKLSQIIFLKIRITIVH